MRRSIVATAVFFATGVVTNGLMHKAELARISSGSWSLLPLSSVILLAEAIPMMIELGLAFYGVRGSNPSLVCTVAKACLRLVGLDQMHQCLLAIYESSIWPLHLSILLLPSSLAR